MIIRQICQRCRAVLGALEIQGAMVPDMIEMSGMMHRTLCPRCGGWVYPVKDGEELPGEFRLSARAIATASLCTGGVWLCFFFVAAVILLVPPDPQGADEAGRNSAWELSWLFVLKESACGAAAGVLLALSAAALASRWPDLNRVHPPGLIPLGQATMLLPVALLGIGLGLLLTLWVAPALAGKQLTLRGEGLRGVLGGVQGLLGGSLGHRCLFKWGRRG
jgi:hypothetical protein